MVLRPNRKLIAGLALVAVTAGAVFVVRSRTEARAVRGERVGTAACLSCHGTHETFTRTAHHLTSRLAGSRTIEGSFETGRNVLRTTNPYLHYRMDSTAAGFFQTAVIGGGPDARSRSEPFHVVIGSGRKGQTYLSWADDSTLVQLPVSFWRGVGWVSSPGYAKGFRISDGP